MLAFVIPVRHPDNAPNWANSKRMLAQTVASIAGQSSPDWRCVIVANHGSDLPPLPAGCDVAWVDFPPNPVHDLGADYSTHGDKLEVFRRDKGRRVLSGLLQARDSDHFMVVDDDDFVSRRLAGFVADHPASNGWFFDKGYVWSEGSRWLFEHPSLRMACGSTHIICAAAMTIPASFADADPAYIRWLGMTAVVAEHCEAAGLPLEPLPFAGAVYRIGHVGSHSQSRTLFRSYILRKNVLTRPRVLAGNLARLHRLTPALAAEFGL